MEFLQKKNMCTARAVETRWPYKKSSSLKKTCTKIEPRILLWSVDGKTKTDQRKSEQRQTQRTNRNSKQVHV